MNADINKILSMNNYVLINQKLVDESQALISVKERACRFGDGIFETFKIVSGIIYDYESHFARIKRGLKALEISAKINNLQTDSYQLIKKNQIKDGILRISISRGIGSMGYLPKDNILPLIIIETISEARYPSGEITLGISKIKAPKRPRILQNCKTMQGLNYVLAKINAKKSGHFDDVILSESRYISECSSTNIFWVKNGKIFTPQSSCDILLGTTREKIIKKFPLKINLVKARLASLCGADEIFLTNSNFLVLPVDKLIVGKKNVKFKKEISSQVLQWLNDDIEKYKCR